MKAKCVDLQQFTDLELQQLGARIATELQKRLANSQRNGHRFEGTIREGESVAEKFGHGKTTV